MRGLANLQQMTIPKIRLRWSEWHTWRRIEIPAREKGAIKMPTDSGVYEVARDRYSDRRLAIGQGTNLQKRVRQDLVRRKGRHSAGVRISKSVDTSRLVIRWATTNWPKAAEEYLHKKYIRRHGKLPKYTLRT